MFTPAQLTTLYDYIKYCRFEAQRKTREADELNNTDVKTEQSRREKELTRLERAIEAEIEEQRKEVKPQCPETTVNPKHHATVQRVKRKKSGEGKKSKTRAVGTYGTSNSANDAKRKRGRPGKTE